MTIKKFFGFTLAEVLITLGIVGVVAALTIPNLIANMVGYQRAVKYKKVISTLNNAIRMNKAKYEWDLKDLNSVCNSSGSSQNPETTYSFCALINGSVKGAAYYYNLSVIKNSKGETYPLDNLPKKYHSVSNINKLPTYIFSDGSMLILSNTIGSNPCTRPIGAVLHNVTTLETGYGTSCYGYIDINGIEGPNKYTRCKSGGIDNKENGRTLNCQVDKKDIGDIFSVVFYDGTVEPRYDNDWVVFNMVK